MEALELAYAYARRKKWEAKLLAAELSQMLSGSIGQPNVGAPTHQPTGGRIPGHQLLGEMGIRIQ